MVVAGTQTVRYAITNLGSAPPKGETDIAALRLAQWAADLDRWAKAGIDFIQLREKHLEAGELFRLVTNGMQRLQEGRDARAPGSSRPRLLVNGRPDVAVAAGADGVHIPARSGELRPEQVRRLFGGTGRSCVLSTSCHSLAEVAAARDAGVDLLLFGPVFEKRVGGRIVVPGTGRAALAHAVETAHPVPVLALGGVTEENHAQCMEAGATGVAAIRLFA